MKAARAHIADPDYLEKLLGLTKTCRPPGLIGRAVRADDTDRVSGVNSVVPCIPSAIRKRGMLRIRAKCAGTRDRTASTERVCAEDLAVRLAPHAIRARALRFVHTTAHGPLVSRAERRFPKRIDAATEPARTFASALVPARTRAVQANDIAAKRSRRRELCHVDNPETGKVASGVLCSDSRGTRAWKNALIKRSEKWAARQMPATLWARARPGSRHQMDGSRQ
jgi:hypothetical protein